eukprot:scaffold57960_cov46-Tisochrysis_lutea.AAC.1
MAYMRLLILLLTVLAGAAYGLRERSSVGHTSRRTALSTTSTLAFAAASGSLMRPRPAHAKLPLTAEQQDELDYISKTMPEQLPNKKLPSGMVIYEMYQGTGRLAQKGDLVYAHFKVWTNNFRNGPPADSSLQDTRPYDWILGQPDDRMRKGFDEAVQGMREDGWRRIIVPPVRSHDAGWLGGNR